MISSRWPGKLIDAKIRAQARTKASGMKDLTGQTVAITGAGAGIGRALTIALVNRGAHVIAIGRSAPELQETGRLCTGPGTCESHLTNVTDAAGLERIFHAAVAQRGGIDLLVNNAAVYPREPLERLTVASWSEGVATNLNGVAFGCRAAIRTFPPQRAAVILNVSSFAHLAPEPASTLYCATKAAVAAFTRALAVELAAANSRLIVNEWIPGRYRTRMGVADGDEPARAFDRLLSTWEASRAGPGGRTFFMEREVVPPRSLRSRVKSWLVGAR
jgi:NAD(P)-dependent dehydrogenase (short-subunit alcohol dehydrogenase family)